MSQETERLWEEFFSRQQLTVIQQDQFKEYYARLVATNKMHNITAITDLADVITDHFEDSLALSKFLDCSILKGLCDIGSGAGFPGLPLKILYPELPLVLLEVTAKKRAFMQEMVTLFDFNDVTILELDWRTFLRQTEYELDMFCARASVQPEELIRVFKPVSPYKSARLVYWASHSWQPSDLVRPYIADTFDYTVGVKQRKLVLFQNAD